MAAPPRLQRARINNALKKRPSPRGSGRQILERYWTAFKGFFNGLQVFVLNAATFGVALLVLVLFWRAMTTPSVKIVEISVPKDLAEKGYGPAQAAAILKENMMNVIHDANSEKKSEVVLTKFELNDITVPGLPLSLQGVEDTLRHFISTAPLWEISGEILSKKNGYGIHLRIWDGKEDQKYDDSSDEGKELPMLMRDAARAAVGQIDPYLLADSYRLTDLNKAEELARIMLSKYPSTTSERFWAHILLGNIYSQRHLYGLAYQEDQRATVINEKMAIAHYNACNDLLSLGKPDEALDECQLAIRIDSSYASAYNVMGAIYQAKGDQKKAESNYDLAIYYDDTAADAHFNKGLILTQRAKWQEAEDEVRKYVSLVPEEVSGYEFLGQILNTEGKWEDSVEEYFVCIRANPSDLRIKV